MNGHAKGTDPDCPSCGDTDTRPMSDGTWYCQCCKARFTIYPCCKHCNGHASPWTGSETLTATGDGHTEPCRNCMPHLWPCGCLVNDAGAHRVGCPRHPEGVRGDAADQT